MSEATPIDSDRELLVLAPSDTTGWFGGTSLIAVDPTLTLNGVSRDEAADALEAAFESSEPRLTAVLLGYGGTATVHEYAGWQPISGGPAHSGAPVPLIRDAQRDLDENAWTERVLETHERIRAGDVYVLNLTYRLSGAPALPAVDAFAQLRATSAGPMSALLVSGDRAIASVSPERFVSVRATPSGRVAEVCPIKGTRPRSADPSEDGTIAAELMADEKERAEHVMIVDLERNDLGVVCEPGSIGVDPLLEVFPTPYCHQMVSRVRGTLRPDASFRDLLTATFPCGSVTGAPKRAAMRIIDELECSPRGAYTGALFVAMPGRMDSSVLIRTLEYLPDGSAWWGTGGGITIDSDPFAEWGETVLKSQPVTGVS